jgi:hypothetical protein
MMFADPLPVVISAPSGCEPTHLQFTGRPVLTLLTSDWELVHLRIASQTFERFVFVKESAHVLDTPAFCAAVDSTEPAWLFHRPSCYMAVYDSTDLRHLLLPRSQGFGKEQSIIWESKLHQLLPSYGTVWPEISDANALRIEQVDGRPELVIGNAIIEKFKGTARCKQCKHLRSTGLCSHKFQQFA